MTIGKVGLGSDLIIKRAEWVESFVIADRLSTMCVLLLPLVGVFDAQRKQKQWATKTATLLGDVRSYRWDKFGLGTGWMTYRVGQKC